MNYDNVISASDCRKKISANKKRLEEERNRKSSIDNFIDQIFIEIDEYVNNKNSTDCRIEIPVISYLRKYCNRRALLNENFLSEEEIRKVLNVLGNNGFSVEYKSYGFFSEPEFIIKW